MRQLVYGGRALLVDNETAECLLDYTAALTRAHGSDTVSIQALGADGNEVEATMLLSAGSQLITESVRSTTSAPTNPEAVLYMKVHTHLLENPPPALLDAAPIEWLERPAD